MATARRRSRQRDSQEVIAAKRQARETAAKETYENAKAWAKEEEKKNGKKRT